MNRDATIFLPLIHNIIEICSPSLFLKFGKTSEMIKTRLERNWIEPNLTWHVHSIRHKLAPQEKSKANTSDSWIHFSLVTRKPFFQHWCEKMYLFCRALTADGITNVIAFLILCSVRCQFWYGWPSILILLTFIVLFLWLSFFPPKFFNHIRNFQLSPKSFHFLPLGLARPRAQILFSLNLPSCNVESLQDQR